MTKKMPKAVRVLIILFFVGLVGTIVFFLIQDNEETPLLEGEVESEENNYISYSAFLDGLENEIENYCNEIDIHERRYEKNYEGFYWLKENNGVELVKGRQFSTVRLHDEDLMNICKERIINYVESNLIKNTKNTGSGVVAFESDNIKCLLFDSNHLDLHCGDVLKSVTPNEYKEIFSYINTAFDLSVSGRVFDVVDNFAHVFMGRRTGAGYSAILKKEEGKWKEIMGTQDMFECEIVFEYEVPPSLVDNTCFFYETTRGTWIYDEGVNEWKKR